MSDLHALPSLPEVERMLAARDIDPCTDDRLSGLILDMSSARHDGDALRETVAMLAYVRRALEALESAGPVPGSPESRYSAELQRLEDIGMWDVGVIGTGGNCTAISAQVGMVRGMGCYMLATTNGEPSLESDSVALWSVGIYDRDGDTVPVGLGEASALLTSSASALETATQRALSAARKHWGQAQRVSVNGAVAVARIDDRGVHFDGGY